MLLGCVPQIFTLPLPACHKGQTTVRTRGGGGAGGGRVTNLGNTAQSEESICSQLHAINA